jgi:hypothetical protein
MAFNPNLPADHANVVAAELRNQFNGLKALMDALQAQLAPVLPALARDANGHWTLTYTGPAQDYWLVWVRWNGNPAWSNSGELATDGFPAVDADLQPYDHAVWWQIKLCGENGDGKPCTPFSNIVSIGPAPEI